MTTQHTKILNKFASKPISLAKAKQIIAKRRKRRKSVIVHNVEKIYYIGNKPL